MFYAIVNDNKVPDNYLLQNKDRIRIITDNLSFGVRTDESAHTSHAKEMIRKNNN